MKEPWVAALVSLLYDVTSLLALHVHSYHLLRSIGFVINIYVSIYSIW
jgi:hypothetical protein